MVDKETAEIGLDALSAAIGEIPEHSRTATIMQPADGANRFLRIVHLQSTGQDVAALACAMAVLARRLERGL